MLKYVLKNLLLIKTSMFTYEKEKISDWGREGILENEAHAGIYLMYV